PRLGDRCRRRTLLRSHRFDGNLRRIPDTGPGPRRAQGQRRVLLRIQLELFARAARASVLSVEVDDILQLRPVRTRGPLSAGFAVLVLLLPHMAAGALRIGALVPDFGMPTLEGRRFSLSEAEKTHGAVVVLFMSTICPYSNYYDDLVREM